jgi:hypothetical protein
MKKRLQKLKTSNSYEANIQIDGGISNVLNDIE